MTFSIRRIFFSCRFPHCNKAHIISSPKDDNAVSQTFEAPDNLYLVFLYIMAIYTCFPLSSFAALILSSVTSLLHLAVMILFSHDGGIFFGDENSNRKVTLANRCYRISLNWTLLDFKQWFTATLWQYRGHVLPQDDVQIHQGDFRNDQARRGIQGHSRMWKRAPGEIAFIRDSCSYCCRGID